MVGEKATERRRVPCPACRGSGQVTRYCQALPYVERCGLCRGDGWIGAEDAARWEAAREAAETARR